MVPEKNFGGGNAVFPLFTNFTLCLIKTATFSRNVYITAGGRLNYILEKKSLYGNVNAFPLVTKKFGGRSRWNTLILYSL